jgi:SAM-dependent methyltransferase
MPPSPPRWQLAQRYERVWWDRRKASIDLDYCREYARFLRADLGGILEIGPQTAILEIGSGAVGTISFLNQSRHRYALDPLENYFGRVPFFKKMRDPHVVYLAAAGENLPFADQRFDLVIIDNVLDHCRAPQQVLAEIVRTLKPEGILYLRLNCHHRWGTCLRQLMELAHIDQGHPHTFTRRGLQRLCAQHGLALLREIRGGYWRQWRADLVSGSLKSLLQGLLFITKDTVLCILQSGHTNNFTHRHNSTSPVRREGTEKKVMDNTNQTRRP